VSLAALVSFLVSLAKAVPALASVLEQAGDEIRKARLQATHDAIDAAVDAAQAQPWVCPAACPHAAARGLRDAGPANQTLPPAS
jgi:hypothetical protein